MAVRHSLAEINRALAPLRPGRFGVPLGFSNTYALAMAERTAQQLGINTISDLARHADCALGLSQEFLNRRDGWPALKLAYGLPFAPRGLDHGLAYEALAAGHIDVMDVYTTDAKIKRYGTARAGRRPRIFPALRRAAAVPRGPAANGCRRPGPLGAAGEQHHRPARMIAMNAAVELDGAIRKIADYLSGHRSRRKKRGRGDSSTGCSATISRA